MNIIQFGALYKLSFNRVPPNGPRPENKNDDELLMLSAARQAQQAAMQMGSEAEAFIVRYPMGIDTDPAPPGFVKTITLKDGEHYDAFIATNEGKNDLNEWQELVKPKNLKRRDRRYRDLARLDILSEYPSVRKFVTDRLKDTKALQVNYEHFDWDEELPLTVPNVLENSKSIRRRGVNLYRGQQEIPNTDPFALLFD
jgi:hypothetical protein